MRFALFQGLGQGLGTLACVACFACVASNARETDPGPVTRTAEPRANETRTEERDPAGSDELGAESTDPHPSATEPTTAASASPSVSAREAKPNADPRPQLARWIVRPTVGDGLRAFAEQRPRRGALFVGPLPGNGGRDVVVYVPPDANPGEKFEIIHHFHGTYSERIQEPGPGVPKKQWVGWNRLEQTMDAAEELQAKRPYNVVLVYPLSAGKRLEPDRKGWSNVAYDRMWMRPVAGSSEEERFDRFHEEVLAVLHDEFGVTASQLGERVFVEGHSAGGIALLNIAMSGSRHPTHYLFQDASFQGWADGCYAALRTADSAAQVIIVITDEGMADAVGSWRPWCLELEAEAAAFAEHRAWCARNPGRTPRRSKRPCEALATAAELWPTSRDWCDGMKKNDLADWPAVTVHRTKVPHGDHPRHFMGGLHLPEALQ